MEVWHSHWTTTTVDNRAEGWYTRPDSIRGYQHQKKQNERKSVRICGTEAKRRQATARGMSRREGDSPLEGDGEGRWKPSWRIFGWEMVEVKLERNDM